jgi:hypothetical protein
MEAATKLQKAGRAFLLRLVAAFGPLEAARVLRALADELEAYLRAASLPPCYLGSSGCRGAPPGGCPRWLNCLEGFYLIR